MVPHLSISAFMKKLLLLQIERESKSAHVVTQCGRPLAFRRYYPPPIWTGTNWTLVYSRNAIEPHEPCGAVPPNSSGQMLNTCGSLRRLKSAADFCLV